MQTPRIPPADPAPATITATISMHAGHICPSSSPSLHVCLDVHLPSSQARGPYGPNLLQRYPLLARLFAAPPGHHQTKQSDGRRRSRQSRAGQARYGHQREFADSRCRAHTRKAALTTSSNCEIKSGSLQWNRFLVGEDGIHTRAVVCYSGDIEFIFVYL